MLEKINYLTAGESHGRGLLGIIEGIPSNLEIDENIDNWITLSNEIFTLPEFHWEGVHLPQYTSTPGTEFNYVNQLRDPYFYKDNNKQYLLYSISGEKGIGILKIKDD